MYYEPTNYCMCWCLPFMNAKFEIRGKEISTIHSIVTSVGGCVKGTGMCFRPAHEQSEKTITKKTCRHYSGQEK